MAEESRLTSTQTSTDLDLLNTIIKDGIQVDRLLRAVSSYTYVTLDELNTEIFSIICDLLYNKNIPIWLCQRIGYYHLLNKYQNLDYNDLIEIKTTNEYPLNDNQQNKETTKVVNRDHLTSYIRKSISYILEDWLTNGQLKKSYSLKRDYPPIVYHKYGMKNKRRKMEDKMAIYDDLNIYFDNTTNNSYSYQQPHCLFAIFDGHSGIEAPHYVSSHLPLKLIKHQNYETNIHKAIMDTFQIINDKLTRKSIAENFKSGTTCCMCLIRSNKLYVAWVGDSQMCLVKNGKPVFISEPHKPNNEKERKRIEAAGGTVTYHSNDWRVNGSLSIARGFGDVEYQPLVSCVPDIVEFELDGKEDYLVIGCDGLWDHMSENEMCSIVYNSIKNNETTNISESLVKQAKDNGSLDNISCLFILLKNSINDITKVQTTSQ